MYKDEETKKKERKFLYGFSVRVAKLIDEYKPYPRKDLAEKLGIGDRTLDNIAKGNTVPDLGGILSIIDYMVNTKEWALTYALGIDKNKKEENLDIGKTYGLSDESLENLKTLNKDGIKRKSHYSFELEWIKNPVNIINWFLSNKDLIKLLSDMYDISAHYIESLQIIKENAKKQKVHYKKDYVRRETERQERFFEFEFQNKILEFFAPIKRGIMEEAKLPQYEKLYIEENKED